MAPKKTSTSKTTTTKTTTSKTSSKTSSSKSTTSKTSTSKANTKSSKKSEEVDYIQPLSEEQLNKQIKEIQDLINKTKQEQLANLPKKIQLQPNSKHKCTECSKFLYTELIQTRSGDEAATLFCYCCNPECPMFEKQTRNYK